MSLYDQLTKQGGARVDWGTLGSLSLGVILAAVAEGYAAIITAVFDAIEQPIDALARWYGTVVATALGSPGQVMMAAWAELGAFVESAGIAGFAVAVTGVALTAYAAAEARDFFGGDG